MNRHIPVSNQCSCHFMVFPLVVFYDDVKPQRNRSSSASNPPPTAPPGVASFLPFQKQPGLPKSPKPAGFTGSTPRLRDAGDRTEITQSPSDSPLNLSKPRDCALPHKSHTHQKGDDDVEMRPRPAARDRRDTTVHPPLAHISLKSLPPRSSPMTSTMMGYTSSDVGSYRHLLTPAGLEVTAAAAVASMSSLICSSPVDDVLSKTSPLLPSGLQFDKVSEFLYGRWKVELRHCVIELEHT